jgi:high-affinity nickel-transport protein
MSADAAEPRASDGFAKAAGILVGLILVVTASASLLVLYFLPSLSVLALLAYSFGCRHGVDADHIAAIDNVTRRLVASAGRRTMLVGVWFSLGHCTVVVLLCAAVILGARTSSEQFESLEALGAAVGPWVAAAMLLTIGCMNLCAARELHTQWRQRAARGHAHELASLVTRCCPSLVEAVDRPSRVFWVGLIFGLGLDTAAEIALLTSTAIALPDVPPACALVLPLLFAAGMALVDSLNAVLMLWAQEWAADEGPMHRLYFSLFLTVASAILGLGIGLVEALGQLATMPWLRQNGPQALEPLWKSAEWLSDHLELLGMGAVGAFLVSTTAAVLLAPRFVISRAACEEEAQVKLRESLLSYVRRPMSEYVVRFE